jgi:hypothetical protein
MSQALALPSVKSPEARRKAGNAKGGSNGRHTVLVGRGFDVPVTVNLKTDESRMRLLEAVADAVIRGRTSALAAATLTNIIKLAGEMSRMAQDDKIAALEADLRRRGIIP